jgi:hypothetical protein
MGQCSAQDPSASARLASQTSKVALFFFIGNGHATILVWSNVKFPAIGVTMVCGRQYDEPQALRQLMKDALSEDELASYCSLEKLVHSSACIMNSSSTGDHLLRRWEEIRRIANDSVKSHLSLILDEISVFGWPEDSADKEPTKLPADTLLDGKFLLPKNEIRAPDGLLHRSCIFVRKEAVSIKRGIQMVNNRPLFWSHDSPPFSWYEQPPKPRSGGRPPTPANILAYIEVRVRMGNGEQRKAVLLDVAAKYEKENVKADTLDAYLQENKQPDWTTSLSRALAEEAMRKSGRNPEEIIPMINALFPPD